MIKSVKVVVKAAMLSLTLLFSAVGFTQKLIHGSLQTGSAPNKLDIVFKPNYDNVAGENILYISISIAVPKASATGVTATIASVGLFSGMTLTPASSYSTSTETIYSWVYGGAPTSPTVFSTNNPFVGATITFTGGSGSAKVRLIDFTSDGGGANLNTFWLVYMNKDIQDRTDYAAMFYATAGVTGSTPGAYPSGDQYVETNGTIDMGVGCASPSSLSASGVTPTSATISWTQAGSQTNYEYLVDQNSTNPGSSTAGTAVTGTSTSVSSLTSSTSYYIHVRTNCGSGSFSPWVTGGNFTTGSLSCTTPSNIQVNNITTASANLTWDVVTPSPSGYEVIISTSNTVPIVAGSPVTTNSFDTASGLISGTQYYAFVRTDCGGGNLSSWSTAIPFVTLCSAVTTPVVSDITENNAVISWTNPGGAASYLFGFSRTSSPPTTSSPTTLTSVDAGSSLERGADYHFYIKTVCNSGDTSDWAIVDFTTICESVDNSTIQITGVTNKNAHIQWEGAIDATGYEYAITTSATPPTSGNIITSTAVDVTTLTAATQYYFHVRSVCSDTNAVWATSAPFTTSSFVCPTTTLPSVTSATATSITFSFDIPSGVDSAQYAVVKAVNDDPPTSGFTTVRRSTTPTVQPPFTATTLNLQGDTTYNIFTRSWCSPGTFSDWTRVTANTTCPALSSIQITNVTNSTADISWAAASGATGYQYVISTNSSTPTTAGTDISGVSFTATGLIGGTTYYVFVRSICPTAGPSATWISRPFSTGCTKPTITSSFEGGGATLSWPSINGGVSYEYAIMNTGAPIGGSSVSTTDTFLHVTKLTPGQAYYLNIRTHCSPGSLSDWVIYKFNMPGVEAYPNPLTMTNSVLTINLHGLSENEGQLLIYNSTGKLVKKMSVPAQSDPLSVDMINFPAGVYLLKYTSGGQTQTLKVLKQ